MELRRLGRSGIKVSPLGLGTARIAGLGWHFERVPLLMGTLPFDDSLAGLSYYGTDTGIGTGSAIWPSLLGSYAGHC